MKNSWIIIYTFFVISNVVFSHGNEKHEKKAVVEIEKSRKRKDLEVFQVINEQYKKNVRKIFKRTCFDCHSSKTLYPWYYKIWGISHLIDSDIREAKSHLDMSDEFPFRGHGNVTDDLNSLKKAIKEGSMPPFLYKLGYPNSKITKEEKKVIINWIESAKRMLLK